MNDKKSRASGTGDASAPSSLGSNVAASAPIPAKDTSPTLNTSAPPPPPAPPQAAASPASVLPQTHQMLDSGPPIPASSPIAPQAAAELQANAQVEAQANSQMHIGVRTDAFGAVEIHTVVEQSQVGITVHSDRDIARWFSAEVPGLESGLNKNHLNLTEVSFAGAGLGAQTGSGSQQGQPRQSFAPSQGAWQAVAADSHAKTRSDTAESLRPEIGFDAQFDRTPSAHVNIHA